MEIYTLLQILGMVTAIIAVLTSLNMIQRKLDARRRLIRRLSRDARFISELKAFQKANNTVDLRQEIERLNAIIHAQLRLLDKKDRERIEASLNQSSPAGRIRFIEKLITDASQLEHAKAH